jgi:quercetin dioxygenase-like cupin family protein
MSASGNEHFNTIAEGAPTTSSRYVDVDAIEPVEYVPGLQFRPVLGERSLVNFVYFDKNTVAPEHVHVEEQIVVVLDGEFEFDVNGKVRTMRAGDVAVIPPWTPHSARTHDTTCREIDVFTPPRSTLIEHARAAIVADEVAAGE